MKYSKQELLQFFKIFDTDNNKNLSRTEMITMAQSIGIPKDNIDEFLTDINLGENGKIEIDDWIK